MKDNTLLIILCVILIVIVLYYIFKKCTNNGSGYSNKLNTSNNENRLVKLNKKNEQMARDLFQDTDETVNLNDFFINNNIKIYLGSSSSVSNNIVSNFGSFTLTAHETPNTSINLLMFKLNTFDNTETNNVWENDGIDNNNPTVPFDTNYTNRYGGRTNNCTRSLSVYKDFVINNTTQHTKLLDKYKEPLTTNVNPVQLKLETIRNYNLVQEITSEDAIISEINNETDTDKTLKYISTYDHLPYYYSEGVNKTTFNIWEYINGDANFNTELVFNSQYGGINYNNNGGGCGSFFEDTTNPENGERHGPHKDHSKFMLVNTRTSENPSHKSYIDDVVPYKFEDIESTLNEKLKMFLVNEQNLKLVFDKDIFKLKVKDDIQDIKVIYFTNSGDNPITTIVELSQFNFTDSIVIGLLIPLGYSARITYDTLENLRDKFIINTPPHNENISYDSKGNTTILTESTLYIDRFIGDIYQEDTVKLDMSNYSMKTYNQSVGRDRRRQYTDRDKAMDHVRKTLNYVTKNFVTPSAFNFFNRMHARKNFYKITKIEKIENETDQYIDISDTSTINLSESGTKSEINIDCHDITFLNNNDKNILLYHKTDNNQDIFVNVVIDNPTNNMNILSEVSDMSNEHNQYGGFFISLNKKRYPSYSFVKYYDIVKNKPPGSDFRLYIIDETVDDISKANKFIMFYYNGTLKFLKKNGDNVELTSKYDNNLKEDYLFQYKIYTIEATAAEPAPEPAEPAAAAAAAAAELPVPAAPAPEPAAAELPEPAAQPARRKQAAAQAAQPARRTQAAAQAAALEQAEQFKGTTFIDNYKGKPIVIDIAESSGFDKNMRTVLYKYQSGIYTPYRYLYLGEKNTIKTNKDLFIVTSDEEVEVYNDFKLDEETEKNKLYVTYDDNILTTKKYKVDNDNVTKEHIYIVYQEFKNNTYSNINGFTQGEHMLLKNSRKKILHCVFDRTDNKYKFEWKKNATFHSLYKNRVLQESYSPFFTINQEITTPSAGQQIIKKKMVFTISNFQVHLEEDETKLLDFFDGFDYLEDEERYIYYNKFDYYEMKNVFSTPLAYKSNPDIQVEIKELDMTFDGVGPFTFTYTIDSNKPLINKNDVYTFDYETYSKTYEFFEPPKFNNNDYMINYTKKMEDLVGCLTNKEYNETYDVNSEYVCEDSKVGSLNINIDKLKNIKKEREAITNTLLTNLNMYKQQALTTIKKTIIPKQKELYELIYEIYNKNVEIEQMNIKLQKKVQFYFNISTNEEYLKDLQDLKTRLNDNIDDLKIKKEKAQKKKYNNLLEVNHCIIKINKNIDEINSYLNIKEKFYQETQEQQNIETTDTAVIGMNTIMNTISAYNNRVSGHFANINKLSEIIKKQVNIKYKITNEIKLNDNVNLYYNQLTEIFKNQQISNNDFIYSTEFSTYEPHTYMSILGNLVKSLDETKMELTTKLTQSNEKHLTLKRKLKKSKIEEVNYTVNKPKVSLIEIELIELYTEINDLNQELYSNSLLNSAQNKLEQIKQLNVNVKNENVNKYNVLEPFVSGSSNNLKKRFHTVQSHSDGYLSVLPNNYSNEYKININGKCLSSYSSKDYNLEQCENKNSQYFEPRLIDSKLSSESINKDTVTDNFVKYPHYQMISTLSSDCLTKEGDNVTIIPCTSNNKHQRWNLVENEVKCLDN